MPVKPLFAFEFVFSDIQGNPLRIIYAMFRLDKFAACLPNSNRRYRDNNLVPRTLRGNIRQQVITPAVFEQFNFPHPWHPHPEIPNKYLWRPESGQQPPPVRGFFFASGLNAPKVYRTGPVSSTGCTSWSVHLSSVVLASRSSLSSCLPNFFFFLFGMVLFL